MTGIVDISGTSVAIPHIVSIGTPFLSGDKWLVSVETSNRSGYSVFSDTERDIIRARDRILEEVGRFYCGVLKWN